MFFFRIDLPGPAYLAFPAFSPIPRNTSCALLLRMSWHGIPSFPAAFGYPHVSSTEPSTWHLCVGQRKNNPGFVVDAPQSCGPVVLCLSFFFFFFGHVPQHQDLQHPSLSRYELTLAPINCIYLTSAALLSALYPSSPARPVRCIIPCCCLYLVLGHGPVLPFSFSTAYDLYLLMTKKFFHVRGVGGRR